MVIDKTSREYWENAFARPPENSREISSPVRLALITEYFKGLVGETVLDLGCGWGAKSIALAKCGFRVVAVDISKNALDHLSRWAQDEGLDIGLVHASAENLPFPSDCFAAVLANSVLDHLSHTQGEAALREISRVLSRSGLLFASFDPQDDDERRRYFGVDSFKNLAAATGLRIAGTELTDSGSTIVYAAREAE